MYFTKDVFTVEIVAKSTRNYKQKHKFSIGTPLTSHWFVTNTFNPTTIMELARTGRFAKIDENLAPGGPKWLATILTKTLPQGSKKVC